MRLATGATHARDTREKAPVFIRVGLTQEAAPSPLSFGVGRDFRDFIYQKPALDRGIHKRDAEKNSHPRRPLRQFQSRE